MMRRSVGRISSTLPPWRIATVPLLPGRHSVRVATQVGKDHSSSMPPRAGGPSRWSSTSTSSHSNQNSTSRQHDRSRDIHSTATSRASASAQPQRWDEDTGDHGDVFDWNDIDIPLDTSYPHPHRQSKLNRSSELSEYDLSPPSFEYDHEIGETPFEDDPHAHTYDPPPSSYHDEYDPTALSTNKGRRRRKPKRPIVDLPPLPTGEFPPDGQSRFDWRETSLSSGLGEGRKSGGKVWYPHFGGVRRVDAQKGLLQVGDVFYDEVERYENHFAPLLQAEYDETERLFMSRLQDWSLDHLVTEGITLHTMVADKFTPPKRVEGEIWTFHKGGSESTKPLVHKFESGSYVFLSRTNPCVDPVLANGRIRELPTGEGEGQEGEVEIDPSEWLKAKVYSRGKSYVRILFPTPVEGMGKGKWRLDMGMSDWSLQMQLQAIKSLHNDPVMQDMLDIQHQSSSTSKRHQVPRKTNAFSDGEEEAIDSVFAELDRAKERTDQTILNGTALRDILLRAFQADYLPLSSLPSTSATATPVGVTDTAPADIDATPIPSSTPSASPRGILARNQLIQSWATRHRSPSSPISIQGDPIITLNPSQTRAMAMMLSERISLVQGPPGTGKTRVIVEVIKLLKKHFMIPHPFLVSAHTNVAVDNLLAPLREEGISAIRSGPSDRVRADLKGYTMEAVSESHPLFDEVDELKKDLEGVQRELKAGGADFKALNNKAQTLRSRIYGLSSIMNREVLLSGDVICTTLLSAASRKLSSIDFPMVFIDEASMATEPLTILAMMKGSSHVAIIGDHKQLPPVIISPEAHAGGLSTSLFERLIHEKNIPSIMLDTQYRMHPAISAFPNCAFYASSLKDGLSHDGTSFDPPISSFLVPDSNVTFLDHDHPESAQSASLANYGDASITCNIIADLLYHNPTLLGSQIGIIAPYTAQVRVIGDYLLSDVARQEAFMDLLGEKRVEELVDIEIKTVDGFQGREKEVMIVSMVRCNPPGYVGFLGDWRRLNVALTRARRALFIVGSARTLAQARYGKAASEQLPPGGAEVLRDHIKHLRKEGLVMSARD